MNRMAGIIYGLPFFFYVLGTGLLQADGDIRIEAYANPARAKPGDRIEYVITVDCPRGSAIIFPENSGDWNGLKCTDSTSDTNPIGEGLLRFRKLYQMETFIAGPYVISPKDVRVRGGDGRETVIKTNEVFLEIKTRLSADDADIRDIKPPIFISRVNTGLLILVIAGLILTVLAVFLLWVRKRKAKPAEIAKPVLPYEKARKALFALKERNLAEQGIYKEYYTALSDIMRTYLEERFHVLAREQTTEEFISFVASGRQLAYEEREILRRFLAECDMVKFARFQPLRNEAETAWDLSLEFVEKTRPEPQAVLTS